MQRMFNIDKWTQVPSGKALRFEGDRPRKVVLEVNAAGTSELVVFPENEQPRFLARVSGRDTVEFYVRGRFALGAEGAACWVYTVDGDGQTFEACDPTSFAVIREKRERNYELELIAAKMAENMNRRLEQQADELARVFERRMAAARAAQRPVSGGAGGPGSEASGADDASSVADDAPSRGRGGRKADRGGSSDT